MASYKMNLARIKGLPSPKKIVETMTAFGLPETEEFGVLNCSGTSSSAFATLIRKTQQAVKQLDAETKELTSAPVEKVTVYPIAVTPEMERLEVYAGSVGAIEQAGIFFSSCMAFKTVTETIEFDVAAAVEKLAKEANKFQLRVVRVSDFAHNAYMTGMYAPKFIDTQHGLDFLAEYAAGVTSASVRFAGPTGRVNITLTPSACFTYSCNEDDQVAVQTILRKLV